ncbi:MAG: DUF4258 domain-containing protein [Phycisphaerae bacterium]
MHAIERMFQRDISEAEVRDILENGQVIESRADDLPFPSRLLSGRSKGRAVHVLVSEDPKLRLTVVVTVYLPDPKRWDRTFRHRR